MWRETKQVEWDTDILLPEKLADLGDEATRAISEPDLASNPNRALFPYNFLRELLSLPLAQSLDEIDTLWLSQILPEMEFFSVIEKHDWQPPTEAQKELVLEGARLLKLKEHVIAAGYGHEKGGQAAQVGSRGYIALCQTPDLDTRLFTLYHELGHIVHHDTEMAKSIISKEQDPIELINEPNFKADLDNTKNYFALGLSTIPSLYNTKAGKELAEALSRTEAQEVLKQYSILWVPPEDPQSKNLVMWGRAKEQRADLFGLRTLLKLKNISSILTTIEHYALDKGSESYLVTQGTADLHPSQVERAVYMIGFLASHGYNVNHELEEWEKRGVCLSGEQATSYATLFTPAWNSSESAAIEKLYREHKQEKSLKKYSDVMQKLRTYAAYDTWKKELKKKWDEENPDPLTQQERLLYFAKYYLNKLKKSPNNESDQMNSLFNYNYLRSKRGQPIILAWQDIDKDWLQEIGYNLKKERAEQGNLI